MLARRSGALLLALPLCWPLVGRADDVKYYDKDGVTYCETTRTVHRPIVETHYVDQQQTVYTEQLQTQIQTSQRIVQVPVWEYVSEPYWVNRWNPFATPYLAYRTVPRLRWESRTQQVQTPVVQRQVIPQQRTVKVPITTQRFVDDQQISRVAVAVKPADPLAPGNTAVANGAAAPQNPAGGTLLDSAIRPAAAQLERPAEQK